MILKVSTATGTVQAVSRLL